MLVAAGGFRVSFGGSQLALRQIDCGQTMVGPRQVNRLCAGASLHVIEHLHLEALRFPVVAVPVSFVRGLLESGKGRGWICCKGRQQECKDESRNRHMLTLQPKVACVQCARGDIAALVTSWHGMT